MENQEYFLGVDVSKATLDIAIVRDGEVVLEDKIPNQMRSIRKFLSQTKKSLSIKSEQMTVCLEHTGIYGFILLEALQQMKVKICVEPALQIKQSQGMTRGKNDKIDARRIAQYAHKNRLELRLWKPQRLILQKLQALLSLRDRLVKVKGQLETPIQEATGYIDSEIARSVASASKSTIKGIEKDLERVEKEIDELVRKDDNLRAQFTRATSVPGIGKITGLHMIVASGEFERIREAKQFACYSGVVPFQHQSGSSIRGRSRVSRLANMTMKKLLHLAAMSAIRYCDEIRAYYLRKVAEGKNKMAVINAVRNKLISRVFACINQQKLYEKNYQNAFA
jgi:transposase